jgi:hypothetical protein
MTPFARTASALLTLGIAAFFAGSAHASDPADLDCTMKFSLSTWSTLLKQSEGSGIVTCEKGHTLRVRIVAKGAGLAVGKSHVDGATGKFSDVHDMKEIFGSYAEIHVGVVKSTGAQLLTKGTVSLALAGNGAGVDLGSGVGEFTLTRGE